MTVRGEMHGAALNLTGGLVIGADMAIRSTALAKLLFSGVLIGGISTAIPLFLAGALAMTLVGIGRLGIPAGYGAAQSAPLAMLIPALHLMTLPPEAAVATGFTVLGLASISIGLAFWLVAALDLQRLVQLVPYSVVTGFLASSGGLLVAGALRDLPVLAVGPETMASAVLVPCTVAALWVATLILPRGGMILMVVAIFAGFQGWLYLADLSPDAARAAGLLPPLMVAPPGAGALLGFWGGADWGVVAAAVPNIVAAVVVGVLGLLLGLSAMELTLQEEIDARRALGASGPVNVVAGLFGCAAVHTSTSAAILSAESGARGRLGALAACAFLAAALVNAGVIASATPVFLTLGLIAYLGSRILWVALFSRLRTQPRPDSVIAFGILATTVIFGMLPAIMVGGVAGALIFVVAYARVPVVARVDSLDTRRSPVDRGPRDTEILSRRAGDVRVMTLQGFVFFGSADALLRQARPMLAGDRPPRRLILDMTGVSGIDMAAVMTLRKLSWVARQAGARIVLAGMRPPLSRTVRRSLDEGGGGSDIDLVEDVDAAIEAAEALILADEAAGADIGPGVRGALLMALGNETDVDGLMARMTREHLSAGTTLIRCGDTTGEIYMLDSGRLAVFAPQDEGRRLRVRSFRPGALVGEIASYLDTPRTADVVAEEDSVVYRLDPAPLRDLERTCPALAAAWHRMVAAMLAERIARTTRLLGDRNR